MSSATRSSRARRVLAVGAIAATLLGVTGPSAVSAGPLPTAASSAIGSPRPTLVANDVQVFVNAHRRRAGAPPVALQWQLNVAAQRQAVDMARHRRMNHTGTDGSTPGGRVSATGYRWRFVGENIAAGQTSPSWVVWAWLNSPPHRAIMLDRRLTQMGLGRAVDANGTPYWCLVLATPA